MAAPDARMAGLAPESTAELQAAARAIRDGRPDEAERLLAGLRTRFPRHAEVLRVGAILRREFFRDEVLTVQTPIPKVAILVHGDAPGPEFVAALSSSRMKPASAAYAAPADAIGAARLH